MTRLTRHVKSTSTNRLIKSRKLIFRRRAIRTRRRHTRHARKNPAWLLSKRTTTIVARREDGFHRISPVGAEEENTVIFRVSWITVARDNFRSSSRVKSLGVEKKIAAFVAQLPRERRRAALYARSILTWTREIIIGCNGSQTLRKNEEIHLKFIE